ncbi:hypothetical protein HN51_023698 [Arachis hypogaea]
MAVMKEKLHEWTYILQKSIISGSVAILSSEKNDNDTTLWFHLSLDHMKTAQPEEEQVDKSNERVTGEKAREVEPYTEEHSIAFALAMVDDVETILINIKDIEQSKNTMRSEGLSNVNSDKRIRASSSSSRENYVSNNTAITYNVWQERQCKQELS